MMFTRVSGAGNSFIVLNLLDSASPQQHPLAQLSAKEIRTNFAKKICSEIPGFASDGFIILDADAEASTDFQWDFYNNDGTPAEMCGNAARCVVLYFYKNISEKNPIQFQTTIGKIQGHCISFDHNKAQVQVNIPLIYDPKNTRQLMLQVGEKKIQGALINSGVPHFVTEATPDPHIARALRKVKDFGPKGANITFIEMDNSDFIQAVTFERGVEDFTLACGTGAIASAYYHRLHHPSSMKQMIEMPGGELIVSWEEKHVNLIGEAQLEFDFEPYEGVFE